MSSDLLGYRFCEIDGLDWTVRVNREEDWANRCTAKRESPRHL
jgi:hypothetical protein